MVGILVDQYESIHTIMVDILVDQYESIHTDFLLFMSSCHANLLMVCLKLCRY